MDLKIRGMSDLTHIDKQGKPTMVDVGDKSITKRTATASCMVSFPPEVFSNLQQMGFVSKKGPIIDTAIIAGTMAVKSTHMAIPFCHPLMINGCKIDIETIDLGFKVWATVHTEGKTGVEMEALHGASLAALTIYDMCKALSHEIVISDLKLVEKRGGKSDYTDGTK